MRPEPLRPVQVRPEDLIRLLAPDERRDPLRVHADLGRDLRPRHLPDRLLARKQIGPETIRLHPSHRDPAQGLQFLPLLHRVVHVNVHSIPERLENAMYRPLRVYAERTAGRHVQVQSRPDLPGLRTKSRDEPGHLRILRHLLDQRSLLEANVPRVRRKPEHTEPPAAIGELHDERISHFEGRLLGVPPVSVDDHIDVRGNLCQPQGFLFTQVTQNDHEIRPIPHLLEVSGDRFHRIPNLQLLHRVPARTFGQTEEQIRRRHAQNRHTHSPDVLEQIRRNERFSRVRAY